VIFMNEKTEPTNVERAFIFSKYYIKNGEVVHTSKNNFVIPEGTEDSFIGYVKEMVSIRHIKKRFQRFRSVENLFTYLVAMEMMPPFPFDQD